MREVHVIGTCDAKFPELAHARKLPERAGLPVVLADAGIFPGGRRADVADTKVASHHPTDPGFLSEVSIKAQAARFCDIKFK
ncbi:MAG: Tm-1-like ATP-binding domain-containing protein [Deltaproteobacteria bacterium]|jgi:uncharacterized protein (UPF0261 family)|nr:Tm-1-like ATP-binding domain-containing protein [Deltaproteobacteria bacterium]